VRARGRPWSRRSVRIAPLSRSKRS